MSVANVLGYGSVLLVSDALGPADFGAIAALTGLGVVASIPAGALQVLVAARRSSGGSMTGVMSVSIAVGGAMGGVLLLAAPLVAGSFSLPSVWPVVWLALTVVPTATGSAQQGILLGGKDLKRLSVLLVVTGGTRLVASIALAMSGASISAVMAAWALAQLVTTLVGAILTRSALRGDGATSRWRWQRLLARSSVSFGALIAMTSIDVILARHYLPAFSSGLYGVASMFARVVFWATQFIAMAVVPRLASAPGRRIVVQAYLAVLAVASPALIALAVAPRFVLRLLGLGDYQSVGPLLVGFGFLGVLWAFVQVSTYVGISRQRHSVAGALWLGVAIQAVLTVAWWNDTTTEVWGAAMVGATASLVALWTPTSIGRLVSRPSATSSGSAA